MTKAEAIAAHTTAYRAWCRAQLTQADLDVIYLRAKALGATDQELREAAKMKQTRQEPK